MSQKVGKTLVPLIDRTLGCHRICVCSRGVLTLRLLTRSAVSCVEVPFWSDFHHPLAWHELPQEHHRTFSCKTTLWRPWSHVSRGTRTILLRPSNSTLECASLIRSHTLAGHLAVHFVKGGWRPPGFKFRPVARKHKTRISRDEESSEDDRPFLPRFLLQEIIFSHSPYEGVSHNRSNLQWDLLCRSDWLRVRGVAETECERMRASQIRGASSSVPGGPSASGAWADQTAVPPVAQTHPRLRIKLLEIVSGSGRRMVTK